MQIDLSISGLIIALVQLLSNVYNAIMAVLTYHVDIEIWFLGIKLDFTLWQAFITIGGTTLVGILIYKVVRWLLI